MNPLDVYKKLPRSNCGRCAAGTCMSFAVQFLRRMVSSSECPELDEQSEKEIDAMLSDTGDWKEKRLIELFKEVSRINFCDVAKNIGATGEEDVLKIRYMGKEVTLRHTGFEDEMDIRDRLLILMYIKQAGKSRLSGKWVAFRDLKDGLLRAESFHGACEISLAKMFEHSKGGFLRRLSAMGAEEVEGFPAEHSFVIYPLPKIPFLVLLRSGDEDFGADCKVLLDSTAAEFLDVEALLYLGMAFVRAMK
ncbi:MAG TPA: DUF3786 domain-containing protein [Nitrospirae bacterium]|nr:DUF3786 domain-containing protein [Nitrospirota bacterium]